MAAVISAEEALRYLSDVDSARFFYVHDGMVLKNVYELLDCLKAISKEDFAHHVNKDKNDFFNWVTDIVQDQKLAKDIKAAKTSATMQKRVDNRIKELKKVAGA